MVRTHRQTHRQTDRQTHKQTDRHTNRLLHMNFFGHAEVVASGLTLLQPIIKNVQTDTVITIQAQLRRLVNAKPLVYDFLLHYIPMLIGEGS